MVPKVGFEPTQASAYGALNTACLPVPPLRHGKRQFSTGKACLQALCALLQAASIDGVESGQIMLRTPPCRDVRRVLNLLRQVGALP